MATVHIDLSAKVEQWERDSVVAACNDVQRIYLVPGRVKQQLRQWLINRHGVGGLFIIGLLWVLPISAQKLAVPTGWL